MWGDARPTAVKKKIEFSKVRMGTLKGDRLRENNFKKSRNNLRAFSVRINGLAVQPAHAANVKGHSPHKRLSEGRFL